jgi:Fe-S-cluster-containing hydrogenase component 2/CRP-like cAMP-binding protein
VAKQIMPEAKLVGRPCDIRLSSAQFLQLSLFNLVSKKPDLDRFPGAIVLRRYRSGDVIVTQGEPGWTAFYVLTRDDVTNVVVPAMQEAQDGRPLERKSSARAALQRLASGLRKDDISESSPDSYPDSSVPVQVATLHLAVPLIEIPADKPVLERFISAVFHQKRQSPRQSHPVYIPADSPCAVDYETLQAPLCEGELFGEVSCLNRTPRTASVVAERECYVLEFLGNILNQLQKDPDYRAQTEAIANRRLLQLHIRRLSFLSHVDDPTFEEIQSEFEILRYAPGDTLYDEYDTADGIYLILSGTVKILKKVSSLLGDEHVRDWPKLLSAINTRESNSGLSYLLGLLPSSLLKSIAQSDLQSSSLELRHAVLNALNTLIKDEKLAELPGMAVAAASTDTDPRTADLPEQRSRFSSRDRRRFNRYLLETLLGDCIRHHRIRVGPESVLSYCQRNDFVGETSMLSDVPRPASCIAVGHPGSQTQVVRIPKEALRKIVNRSSAIRALLITTSAEREGQAQRLAAAAVWEEKGGIANNELFESLGLIQGQELLLIDLEKCTRCNECVEACESVHDDGLSRLHLTGPRFDKYLVATSCRACLDPVCMIGCPVGAIHRGAAGEMVIEQWCIGCGLCANQCPYSAIRMQDRGIIPEHAQYAIAGESQIDFEHFFEGNYDDSKWPRVLAPVCYDRELLSSVLPPVVEGQAAAREPFLCLRHEFEASWSLARAQSLCRLELICEDSSAVVWLNGKALKAISTKGNRKEFWIPSDEQQPLRVGRNTLALRIKAPSSSDSELFKLRLDQVSAQSVAGKLPEPWAQRPITHRSVVCDLCSEVSRHAPACVRICAHGAAIRVDARFNFPA